MPRKSTDPRVIAPRQSRSRATMERIVTATEELLAFKPFEQITITEISKRAGSAPTAIYARFSDKDALLFEVHERFKQRIVDAIAVAFDSPERADWTDEKFVSTAVSELVELYDTHHHMLRSVLLADNTVMYEQAAELARAISESLAARLLSSIEDEVRDTAERDLDFAVRAALALLQQSALFADLPPTRFTTDADELSQRITNMVLAAAQ
ncbi:TetR/AcrR family transcriptional regulator [Rhodococcus sp. NPDC060086]|uniref:TetR/AcrR family transcriptional regulator n=1 Tax=unclassified Rhodococcus (in: high G+C Gram-positive bacteria) TaxID=192944 RepID=UPI0036639FE4